MTAGLKEPSDMIIKAADGYELAGTVYASDRPDATPMVIAGATGVPRQFYRRFAEYAQARQYHVLTFDYRGVGRSEGQSLKGSRINMLDWGRLDFSAALEAVASPSSPAVVVGHSFGGHALGLVRRPELVSAACVFATGAGWHGHIPYPERLRVLALWNIILPPLIRWKGYAPFKMLKMGENLPLGVYQQWKRWCRYPHYFFDDPKMMPDIAAEFLRIRFPIMAVNALDDLWALPASRSAFMGGYKNATIIPINLDPALFGGKVGHMGYFRPHVEPLWDDTLKWLGERLGSS
ncbi:alpha/beta fold hydrolase [Desulfosarcina sp. OttesenSCG-928-A07]|nr:alpha/beta fold hydrolase [Desulfosarcina sp. OttesenSCG-928-G17]MDL2329239.1 alpha/beta fold hydrolase [Desulfosarcina sp. OttesenSCG-928-A07]